MDPHLSQDHAGLQHAVFQSQQEITSLKPGPIQPTSPSSKELHGYKSLVKKPTYSFAPRNSLHIWAVAKSLNDDERSDENETPNPPTALTLTLNIKLLVR